MQQEAPSELFLITAPGLEAFLADEARAAGLDVTGQQPGGVTLRGGWSDVWRANMHLRGATRVLMRVFEFRAMHLAQLDKRARKLDWASLLAPGQTVAVEVVCRKSRIYHAGAARERIERALVECAGVTLSDTPQIALKARIEDDLCTISLDTSGEALHKRGFKQFVGKAPLRETMAALFLRACGYDGRETVVDPMCGSGTFVLEAVEIAAALAPGRARAFTFEHLSSFDAGAVQALRGAIGPATGPVTCFGFDRDQSAISGAQTNADRAGVAARTNFACQPISDLQPPPGPPGLVMVNPPYGARIGNRKLLFGLYGTLGQVLKDRFTGWRVGLVTSDAGLAKSTQLPFLPTGPVVAHGGLKIRLYHTNPL